MFMIDQHQIATCLQKCDQALSQATIMYATGENNQQEYDDIQRYLEEIAIEIERLSDYSTQKDRDELYCARLDIQQMQNKLLLKNAEDEEWGMYLSRINSQ